MLFFMIIGVNEKVKTIETGHFKCPQCQTERQYIKKKIIQYFTLFFIPLFKIKDLGEFMECAVCKTQYFENPEHYKRKWVCPKCSNVNSSTDHACNKCGYKLL